MGLAEAGRALLAAAWTRLAAEWRASPFNTLALRGPAPVGVAASPRDMRPVEGGVGVAALEGRYVFAGKTMEVGRGGDPWDRLSPSRAFAAALHRFDVMPGLLAIGPDGAREALRLALSWRRLFDGAGDPGGFAWSAEILERRVAHWALGARALASVASEAETSTLLASLARQARVLLGRADDPGRAAERAAVATLAGAVLAGAAGEALMARALPQLERALEVTPWPDGAPATRCPQQALELVFDLHAVDDALAQRGRETPAAVSSALDRLAQAVRFFTLADGRLCAFQGGEGVAAERVAAALAVEGEDSRALQSLPHGRYHRIEGRSVQVVVDAGPPADGAWSWRACGQPAAMEAVCGGDRLVVNAGWSPDAQGPAALRLADAASTMVLADGVAGAPLQGFQARALGPRLAGGTSTVEVRRHADPTGVWLELSHDGWAHAGLVHERRLFLAAGAEELRGEDRVSPAAGREPGRRVLPYALRFHLAPEVRASIARDGRSVLLRGASGRGWWLRNDAPEVALEPSVQFERTEPRRSLQVVMRGRLSPNATGRVRWKLSPMDAATPEQGGS